MVSFEVITNGIAVAHDKIPLINGNTRILVCFEHRYVVIRINANKAYAANPARKPP
jgi:hypothetical protein